MMHTMLKFLAILVMALACGTAALAQEQAGEQAGAEEVPEEQEPQEAAPGAEQEEDGAEEDGDPAFDESVLDDQTYEGEDDGFIPSEEVPVDEPIPFPTDI